jgi:hypothetical protein
MDNMAKTYTGEKNGNYLTMKGFVCKKSFKYARRDNHLITRHSFGVLLHYVL